MCLHVQDMNYSLCLPEDRYSQNTRTIQVDFTDGHSIYPAIAEELQGLEIGILGNGTLEKQKETIMKFFSYDIFVSSSWEIANVLNVASGSAELFWLFSMFAFLLRVKRSSPSFTCF